MINSYSVRTALLLNLICITKKISTLNKTELENCTLHVQSAKKNVQNLHARKKK